MKRTTAGLLAMLLTATASCAADLGDGPGLDPDDDEPLGDPPEAPRAPDDLDYTNTPWTLTNVSQTPGTISHHAQLALEAGHAVIAFSEPAANDYGDQDIHRAIRVGDTWETHSLTVTATEQLAFPSIIGSDGELWYAYTGLSQGEEPDSDIWIQREPIGSPTGEAFNVTAHVVDLKNPDVPARSDVRSQLVAGPDGVYVVYISRPRPGDIAPNDIRVVEVSASGEVGAPRIVYSPTGYCSDLGAVGGIDGAVHAVVDCGGLEYITNASGSWESSPVPLGASRFPFSPDIAVDPSGSVHLVWSGAVDCEGTTTCRHVHHSRDLGEPTAVSTENGYMPEVAGDASGRVLVVYHRTGDAPAIMVTHSDDGLTFQPPRAIDDSEHRDTSASHLQFDTSGWPHLVFERIISGSTPLDGEIIAATIR